MKKLINILLVCIVTFLAYAQNYEQQGDELFARAQYEKAIKKYRAAEEVSATSSELKDKLKLSNMCHQLLAQALQTEYENDWDAAASLYWQLFAVHPLSLYKAKSDDYKRKILVEQQEYEKKIQEAAEAERLRQETLMQKTYIWKSFEETAHRQGDNYYPNKSIVIKKIRFDYTNVNRHSCLYCFIILKSKSNPNYCEVFSIAGDQYGRAGNVNVLKKMCKYIGNNVYEYEITQVDDAYIESWQYNFPIDAIEVYTCSVI